jgi:hypothetical protein
MGWNRGKDRHMNSASTALTLSVEAESKARLASKANTKFSM